jgi:hypothetical protein
MVQARVQILDVRENGRKGGSNSFLGGECKEPNVVGKVMNYTEHVFGPPPGPVSLSGSKMSELNARK